MSNRVDYKKAKKISLAKHPDINEKWVQDLIYEDPSILDLGEIEPRDKERIQPSGGRLDLLFVDTEKNRRYEVELQLGKTDETHIIRTIEYWDIERKRYPQYDHCAVLIAEDITTRFLNVVSLFNGHIPIIAIQVNAIEIDGQVSLIFTKVLDEMSLGLIDEDDQEFEERDRNYWDNYKGKEILSVVDELIGFINTPNKNIEPNYNKYHIGLKENGSVNNFIVFNPKKSFVRVAIRMEKSDEVDEIFENSELDFLDYSSRSKRYRFRIKKQELNTNKDLLINLFNKAYQK
jgi:hypothetical protein